MHEDVLNDVLEKGLKFGIINEAGLHDENFEEVISSLTKEQMEEILIKIYDNCMY